MCSSHVIFFLSISSTFTSSTPNLSSVLHTRLSARSFDPPLKVEQIYESQVNFKQRMHLI
jgi:hypothetical protein